MNIVHTYFLTFFDINLSVHLKSYRILNTYVYFFLEHSRIPLEYSLKLYNIPKHLCDILENLMPNQKILELKYFGNMLKYSKKLLKYSKIRLKHCQVILEHSGTSMEFFSLFVTIKIIIKIKPIKGYSIFISKMPEYFYNILEYF